MRGKDLCTNCVTNNRMKCQGGRKISRLWSGAWYCLRKSTLLSGYVHSEVPSQLPPEETVSRNQLCGSRCDEAMWTFSSLGRFDKRNLYTVDPHYCAFHVRSVLFYSHRVAIHLAGVI